MGRRHRWGWTGVMVVLVVLAAWGCRKESGSVDTPNPSPVPVPPAPHPSTSEAIIAEAESLYTYARERPQLAVNDSGFPGPYVKDEDSLPRMWIAAATLKDTAHRPAGRIIARIRSERAYPMAGIDSGYNYVWRNTWRTDSATAASWEMKIVSHDTATKAHTLTRDFRKHEYTHGDAREPRLVRVKVHSVAFGACFDDPICPTGHCGYY
jgi:hypothetical protein